MVPNGGEAQGRQDDQQTQQSAREAPGTHPTPREDAEALSGPEETSRAGESDVDGSKETDDTGSDLDEEDRELIRDNLRKRTAAMGPGEGLAKKVALESLFDDEDEPEEEAKTPGPKARHDYDDDDMRDFIVDDDDDDKERPPRDKGETRETEGRPQEAPRRPKKIGALSFLQRTRSTLSYEVWHELMDIFGDGSEYQAMLDSFVPMTVNGSSKDAADDGDGDRPKAIGDSSEETVDCGREETVDHVSNEAAAYVQHALQQTLPAPIGEQDVRAALQALVVEGQTVACAERFGAALSHMPASALHAILDAYWQWRGAQRDQRICAAHGLRVDAALDVFETLPAFVTKFPTGPPPELTPPFPEPPELPTALHTDIPITSKAQLDAVALYYALHPQSFAWLHDNFAQQASVMARCSATMGVVLERAWQLAASSMERARRTRALRAQRREHLRSLERSFSNYLCSRPVVDVARESGGGGTVGAIYVDHGAVVAGIVDIDSGDLRRPVSKIASVAAVDRLLFGGCCCVVVGGQGPLVRWVAERLSEPDAADRSENGQNVPSLPITLVRPLLQSSSLEARCLHVARLAIDPLTEVCAHAPHRLLARCTSDDDAHVRGRCLLPMIGKSAVVRLTDAVRRSAWRQAPLRVLLGGRTDLVEAVVREARSRADLRALLPARVFRNVAGFVFFPDNGDEPRDALPIHPDDYNDYPLSSLNTSLESTGDWHKGSIEATDEERASMLLALPLSALRRGQPLTGVVVKCDYPHALYLRLEPSRSIAADSTGGGPQSSVMDGVIRRPRARVPMGKSATGLIERIDGRRYRIELVPDDKAAADGAGTRADTLLVPSAAPLRPEDAVLVGRARQHPFYRADLLTGADVERFFAEHGQPGDMVVRASARRAGHVVLAWKLTGQIVPQLDLEAYKGCWHVRGLGDAPSSSSALIPSTFEDLDEIVARLVDQVAQAGVAIVASPKFIDPFVAPDTDALTLTSDRMISRVVERTLHTVAAASSSLSPLTAYGIWLSREHAGLRAFLSSMPKLGRFVHEPVGIRLGSGQLELRGKAFDSLPALVDWWKRNYSAVPPVKPYSQPSAYAPSYTQGSASSRSRDYHGGRRR